MSIKLAVFDCDGTLSDGQAAVCIAMESAFAAHDLPCPSRNSVRRIVGLSLPQAIRALAPEANDGTLRDLVESYKQAFRTARENGSLQEPLYDGIADLLARLDAKGWVLGVATGKSDRGLKSTLAVHGLSGLFGPLHTADRHPSKPHPSMLEAAMQDVFAAPENTVMIGDTVYDMQMARAARTRAIGVDWGYHEAGELLEAGAQGVARTMVELEEMIG